MPHDPVNDPSAESTLPVIPRPAGPALDELAELTMRMLRGEPEEEPTAAVSPPRSDDLRQIIVFRRDLNMRKGKIAAQVAHGAMAVFFNRASSVELRADGSAELRVNLSPEMAAWLTSSFAKVVLQVDTEDDLLRLRDLCAAAAIPHALITDAGRTEFHGVPTHTVLAIGPARRSQTDPLCGPDGAVTCRLA